MRKASDAATFYPFNAAPFRGDFAFCGAVVDEFFAMGGYGAYVWPAYLISAVTLAGLVAHVLRRAARARKRLQALEKSDG
jgi:heme exporter protein D